MKSSCSGLVLYTTQSSAKFSHHLPLQQNYLALLSINFPKHSGTTFFPHAYPQLNSLLHSSAKYTSACLNRLPWHWAHKNHEPRCWRKSAFVERDLSEMILHKLSPFFIGLSLNLQSLQLTGLTPKSSFIQINCHSYCSFSHAYSK